MTNSYESVISKEIGTVDKQDYSKLKAACVFVCGVEGVGEAALTCLSKAGVENFVIADCKAAGLKPSGKSEGRAKILAQELQKRNPAVKIRLFEEDWMIKLDILLPQVDVVVNGCESTKTAVLLMREARKFDRVVIDAFSSALPSVYAVRPKDPRPEETFKYPSKGRDLSNISEHEWNLCAKRELEYILTHTSTANHVDWRSNVDLLNDKNISFQNEKARATSALREWITGCMMAYEAIKVVLERPNLVSYKGVFLNPWNFRYEKPKNALTASFRRFFVRKYLDILR